MDLQLQRKRALHQMAAEISCSFRLLVFGFLRFCSSFHILFARISSLGLQTGDKSNALARLSNDWCDRWARKHGLSRYLSELRIVGQKNQPIDHRKGLFPAYNLGA